MSTLLAPRSPAELVEFVRATPRILAVGNTTKPRLSAIAGTKVCLSHMRGIVEYEPTEFTFTALAGTPISELAAALAERGQYLPFDPMLVEAGTTLGGTVASGLSGPCRFRFGGLKDFILGARFVDGAGRLLRLGGKVVKNAAGFDLPKFLVGSLGRFGILVELTFKVFPARAEAMTCRLQSRSLEETRRTLAEIVRSRFEPAAIDIPPGSNGLLVRLEGPASALDALANDLLQCWPGEKLGLEEAEMLWTNLQEFAWADPHGSLVKVALAADLLGAFSESLANIEGVRVHISSGGNVAFVSLRAAQQAGLLSDALSRLMLSGLTLRGDAPLWLGTRSQPQIARAVKSALDPEGRFPGLDE